MLYKYPRTPHLPWSEGVTDDDKILKDINVFKNKEIHITEKMDGENTTLYPKYYHARSLDSADHESQHWLKNFYSGIKHMIPEGFRICGENLFAKHSIYYEKLYDYFMVFSVWENNKCLSCDDTTLFCLELGLSEVPYLYQGIFNEEFLKNMKFNSKCGNEVEGYVIRNSESFYLDEFQDNVAKYVRKNHVQTDEHWKNQKLVKNQLER